MLRLFLISTFIFFVSCTSVSKKQQGDDAVNLAQEFYNNSNYERALLYYKIAYRIEPSIRLEYNIGRTLLELNRYKDVLKILESYLSKHPDSTILLELKAYSLYQESLLLQEEALTDVGSNEEEPYEDMPTESKKTDKDTEEPENNTSVDTEKTIKDTTAEAEKKKAESINIFVEILERNPYRQISLYNLGLIRKAEKKDDEAESLWLRAIDRQTIYEPAVLQLLNLYSATQNTEAISKLAKNSLSLIPNPSLDLLLPFFYANGDYSFALEMVAQEWEKDQEARLDPKINFYYGSLSILANEKNSQKRSEGDMYLQRALDFGFSEPDLIFQFVFSLSRNLQNKYQAYFIQKNIVSRAEFTAKKTQ